MKMNFQVKVNMVGPPGSSLLLLSFLLFLCCPGLWSYEAPIDKQDVFAKNACPAFLTYRNVAFLSGVTVELPCRCKPEMVQSVTWFYRKHLDTSKDTRALTDHHGNKLVDPSGVLHSRSLQSRFSIRLFSLLIFRAGPDDSGVYVCGSSQGDYFYGYDLDIQEAQKIDFIQRFSSGAPSAEPDAVERPGSARSWYRLFTSFRPWSVCDRCGIPGEQIRIGLCYIRSHALHVRYRGAHQKVVSCGSGGKPKAFRRMKRSGAGAKMEVRNCEVICPSPPAPSSRILSLLSFIGLNSVAQLWDLPVYHLNHPAKHLLTLGCPGAQANMAVAWDKGSKPIYRSKHLLGGDASSHRLYLDAGHHLVFNPATVQDSGIYTCWLQGRPAAQLYLLVYAHLGHGQSVTSHREFPSALRSTLKSYTVMTAVFCFLVLSRAAVRFLRDAREEHVD
ncbi:Ig-like V-type domain-containing protein FAM187A isoform X1 [Takifugu rubripes]|uniref:Ig-like V-type domain-containing protein FAM187A isoform X1 n=1 Tax=Takifugu rubripes TaxID=31033 RepID=UPI0011455627|nr:Ig-like V-type domain-containing protein FAM187A isoform X1 [Takifugu rubripes]